MLEDFYHTGKIQRLRPGLNLRTRVPEASNETVFVIVWHEMEVAGSSETQVFV
jgi:hypothetical protein